MPTAAITRLPLLGDLTFAAKSKRGRDVSSLAIQTLDHLRPGDCGTIDSIVGADSIAGRLMEMGLTVGQLIEVVAIAPFGDPMEIRVRSYELSLRKSEAGRVLVRKS